MTKITDATINPVVLVILDGWGYREETDGNAIAAARTPVMDSLWDDYPRTLLQASGKAVGLPKGQMGNSEVGHLNIGAGRTVPQELVRISDAIEDGSLLSNRTLVEVCRAVQQSGGKLHLTGLCSEGGVHSHINHLFALLDLAKAQGISEVCIHILTDGRDTQPTEGKESVRRIQDYIARVGVGRIVTLSGRYYGMDRDRRWERIQRTYEVMIQDGPGNGRSAVEVLATAYAEGITDEFLPPTRIAAGAVEPGDGLIFFNFRPDRARQLTQAFVDPNFNGFERQQILPLHFVTFTQYDPNFPVSVVLKPQNLGNILGEVIAHHGLKQIRIAETEKYAHVTYFFNGGIEGPFKGEDRVLIPSPMVLTYDLAPEMSAKQVTTSAISALEKRIYSLIVINFTNPDMVGHTGQMDATIKAIEAVDRCLYQLLKSVSRVGGTMIITADHGNAECMQDEQGNPWTSHTNNPVPFILVGRERLKASGYRTEIALRPDGCLADIAPTILEILGLPKPPEMTGLSLVYNRIKVRACLQTHNQRRIAPITILLG